MPKYEVAGLGRKIELPVPLIIDLIPASRTAQRPGIKRATPGYWVQHETGNSRPGAGAKFHSVWLHSAEQAQVQTSFHFCIDDHVAYQFIPVDEVTWQAADGAGPGNMSGVSCELCINSDGNWPKAKANAEALAGAICAALGLGTDRVKKHYDFNYNNSPANRHHCPDQIMNEGYWPTFVANVGKIISGIGTVPEPEATPATTTTAKPVADPNTYPPGMDIAIATRLFGGIERGGKSYTFNPNGPVSQFWLKLGPTWGYPAISDAWALPHGPEYVRFGNLVIFRMNSRSPWTVLGEV